MVNFHLFFLVYSFLKILIDILETSEYYLSAFINYDFNLFLFIKRIILIIDAIATIPHKQAYPILPSLIFKNTRIVEAITSTINTPIEDFIFIFIRNHLSLHYRLSRKFQHSPGA